MNMSFWIITSWVLVALLTGINIFVFMKLKTASEQMMQMAFPGTKDMGEAMKKMQQMMGGMGAMGGARGGRGPGMPGAGGGNQEQQLKQAMQMLQQMQGKGPKR
jgi:hypothetical protein